MFYIKKNGFTLVELVIVIVILGILTTIAVSSYLGMSRLNEFEITLEKIYSNIGSKEIETIVSGNKLSKMVFDKKFDTIYYSYFENKIDPIDTELKILSGTTNKDNINFTFAVNGTIGSNNYLVKDMIDGLKQKTLINSLGLSGSLNLQDANFLNLKKSELKKLSFYIEDNSNFLVKTGKINIFLNSDNSNSKDINLKNSYSNDFQGNTYITDRVEIIFSGKGKKSILGYNGSNQYNISTSKLSFVDYYKNSMFMEIK